MEMATCEKCADVEGAVLALEARVSAITRQMAILQEAILCLPAAVNSAPQVEPPKPVILKQRLTDLDAELAIIENLVIKLTEVACRQLGGLRLA